jgi:hypothetical protein
MQTGKEGKVTHQRNITPNFLRFKRINPPIQANPPPAPAEETRTPSTNIQLKGAAPKINAPASTYTKNASYTLAN